MGCLVMSEDFLMSAVGTLRTLDSAEGPRNEGEKALLSDPTSALIQKLRPLERVQVRREQQVQEQSSVRPRTCTRQAGQP